MPSVAAGQPPARADEIRPVSDRSNGVQRHSSVIFKEVVMKRVSNGVALFALLLCLLALLPSAAAAAPAPEDVFYISAAGRQLAVKLENTAAAKELKALLDAGDLTVPMTKNSFEQYGSLGRTLTANDTSITAQPGDVLLYNANTICLFYAPNSYQYTRLGKIQNLSDQELRDLLSGDNLTITLTQNAFGNVPNTGTADLRVQYDVMIALLGAAVVLWGAAIRTRRGREESVIEKTERE